MAVGGGDGGEGGGDVGGADAKGARGLGATVRVNGRWGFALLCCSPKRKTRRIEVFTPQLGSAVPHSVCRYSTVRKVPNPTKRWLRWWSGDGLVRKATTTTCVQAMLPDCTQRRPGQGTEAWKTGRR
jgi:hypothetical protein